MGRLIDPDERVTTARQQQTDECGEEPDPWTPHPAAEFDCRLGRLDATTDPTTDDEGDCLEAEPDETPGLLGRTIAHVRGVLP
jgi:hypothetical protein